MKVFALLTLCQYSHLLVNLTITVYSHWFQENSSERQSQRNPKKFKEEMVRTTRLYNRPKFYMQILLNDSSDDPPIDGETAFDCALNDPFQL